MEVAFLIVILGANLLIWTLIGVTRFSTERIQGGPGPLASAAGTLSPADVAVLIPAHNEEPVIAATLASALRLVAAGNVHVVADGCRDATATIAREHGVHVLELNPGRGKAGAIEAAVAHFAIPSRYPVLLIADADTELDERYLTRGLPMLDQPGVAALAGYAMSGWRPKELSLVGRYLVSYRARVYAVMQWLKYGQTWRWTSVTPIVPGFASMYRTEILGAMDLNPPGLVIEDFNMTFEIHHKRLGKIAFRPGVRATTQDPDNFFDYYRQVLRWHLGFWQTLRRHGVWRSGFSAALVLFVAEVMLASIALILLVAWLGTVVLLLVAHQGVFGIPVLAGLLGITGATFLTLTNMLLFIVLPDYLLTCVTALGLRRPSMLLYGVGFMLLRFVDATAIVLAIPLAWWSRSTGQWNSPARRPVPAGPRTPLPLGVAAKATDGAATAVDATAADAIAAGATAELPPVTDDATVELPPVPEPERGDPS